MKKISLSLTALVLSFVFMSNANAGIGSLSISGTTLNNGDTKTLSINVSSNIMSVDGNLSSSDTSCIQIVGKTYFTKTSMEGDALPSHVADVQIKAVKAGCTATIKITNASLNTVDAQEERNLSFTSGTITVKEESNEPSQPTNNNQPSEKPASNTSNNTNTSSNTSTTNTEVKKSGSSNNNLSSLSISGYSLDKKFSSSTTSYSINVAKDVKSITVSASAEDSKAKVTTYGGTSLKGGKNTVSVVVVAENGSKKTYTIIVNKEKDPNEVEEPENPEVTEEVPQELSNVNTLEDIRLNVGILSPGFNKNRSKYLIYLPYEIDDIEISPVLTDPTATYEISKSDKLVVGTNEIYIKVTAANGDVNTYTLIVRREIDPNAMDNDNTFLKVLDIKNGSLLTEFYKGRLSYYYKGNDLDITAIPEDDNAIVNIFKDKNTYYIMVEAPNGTYRVYTLKPYRIYNSKWFIVSLPFIGFIAGYISRIFYKSLRNRSKKKKLEKQNLGK